ncbi:MAG: NADH-quinone oxidoreductase subunit C [Elusimicrobiota bacterium]
MSDLLNIIRKNFGKNLLEEKIHNQRRVYMEISPAFIRRASEFLFNQMKMRFATASGVDEKEWMEIVYHFSFDREGLLFNLRVKLDKKNPRVDTITDIITGAKWIERELNELFGIEFEGNDDMRNLLLSDAYKGDKHPLRKHD